MWKSKNHLGMAEWFITYSYIFCLFTVYRYTWLSLDKKILWHSGHWFYFWWVYTSYLGGAVALESGQLNLFSRFRKT